MPTPNLTPLLILAVVGFIVLSPILVPLLIVSWIVDWFETRRSLRKIEKYFNRD